MSSPPGYPGQLTTSPGVYPSRRRPGRAFFRFILAVLWLAVAWFLAVRAARGFAQGEAFLPVRNLFAVFLLLLGQAYMELVWDGERRPLAALGLGRGAGRGFALGAALGWAMSLAVMLAVALAGNFYVHVSGSAGDWRRFALETLILASGTLAAEIAFRGYPFQKLAAAFGPGAAVLLAALFFGVAVRMAIPGTTRTAMAVSALAAAVLSVVYLKTRSLWGCWGLHFAWLWCIGVLFGQPLAGNRAASGIIRSAANGPEWLTGGEYGPAASVVALIVLLAVLVWVGRWSNAGNAPPG